MYDYIGKKIKAIASVSGWISLFAGIIACIVLSLIDEDLILTGVAAAVSGVLGLISSWFLYGFGQLVDDVGQIVSLLRNTRDGKSPAESTQEITKSQSSTVTTVKSVIIEDSWICQHCQTKNSINYGQCKKCGKFRG